MSDLSGAPPSSGEQLREDPQDRRGAVPQGCHLCVHQVLGMKTPLKVLGAAALLLVGLAFPVAGEQPWVLIVPPSVVVDHKVTDRMDPDAPISRWLIQDRYISEQECVDGLRFDEELTVKAEHYWMQKSTETPSRPATIRILEQTRRHLQDIRAARCVTAAELRAAKRDAR
jgi:hypothetical protein